MFYFLSNPQKSNNTTVLKPLQACAHTQKTIASVPTNSLVVLVSNIQFQEKIENLKNITTKQKKPSIISILGM